MGIGQYAGLAWLNQVFDHVVQAIQRALKPTDAQVLAEVLREELQEYRTVAQLFAVAAVLNAAANKRAADADYVRAQAEMAFVAGYLAEVRARIGAVDPLGESIIEDFLTALRTLLEEHIVDYDRMIEQPLVRLLSPPSVWIDR